ncbi:FtsW/RodA/SpoVE family cell cycle protein [Acididesulfobacillus acetoxydans]|nr:FtsW/RodA/SpoVE family cell cycle protein [Acididesulfobacillus acetoxydans]
MKTKFSLRLIIFAILWLGLGVLHLEGKLDPRLLGPAGAFTLLMAAGAVLERVTRYRGDPFILPTVEAIVSVGVVFLARIRPDLALHQLWWAMAGLVLYYLLLWGLRDYRRLGNLQYFWGLAAVGLLVVTLLFGVTSGGATSWLRLGPFTVEPEELVKVALLLFLASYLGEHETLLRVGTVQIGRMSVPDVRTLGPFLLMAAFSLGLLAAQKSLGTALVFYALFVLLLYAVTDRALYLGVSIPVFLLTGWLGYTLFGHVRVRVEAWLNPWRDIAGGGYQIAQSLFAIAGGGVLGTGLGNGIAAFQVPAVSTDFIFAAIAEELGFVGAMAVICLFLIVVLRAFSISMKTSDHFGQILAAGIGILIGTESLVILTGVTKLLPLTGIPLPWISYGGSSMLVHFLLLGLLSRISQAESKNSLAEAKGREYAT